MAARHARLISMTDSITTDRNALVAKGETQANLAKEREHYRCYALGVIPH
jgi:hypothetical protein